MNDIKVTAQPVAPTFSHPGAEEVFQRLRSAREQPAAPTPTPPNYDDVPRTCGSVHKLGHCPKCVDRGEPAAPEPSAEPPPELAMTAQERMSWGAHQSCFAQIGSWKVRAESAEAQLAAVRERVTELESLLNTPQVADWTRAVQLEAGHQRERWGSEHDAGKTPADWFWLLGYLGGKALYSATSGNTKKALHHTISAGAALANWHLSLTGADTSMRPGIAEPLPAPSPGAGETT